MLTRDDLAIWVTSAMGTLYPDRRITDAGFAFLVDTQPEAYHNGDRGALTYGNGPVVVLKRTGEYWYLASNPDTMAVLDARTERRFRRALRKAALDPKRPHGVVPAGRRGPVSHARLVAWVAGRFRTVDGRVRDLGWAYAVSTQPDAYHDGDGSATTYGNGEMIVVKRTGAVWLLGSDPHMVAAARAGSEAEFDHIMGSVFRSFDPNRPHEWL